ncbi:hypothetical protein V8G54_025306 [Vigna mungo]|uniref:Uncharacterized protein n=1 Tax=Vigna mungo TaxID=3915 RepID=A0AAQ3N6U4_VIGMU
MVLRLQNFDLVRKNIQLPTRHVFDVFNYWFANLIPFSIDDLSSPLRLSRPCFSKSERGPNPRTSSTPFFPSLTFEAKKGSSVTVDCTNEHSTTSGTPLRPLRQASAKRAPA